MALPEVPRRFVSVETPGQRNVAATPDPSAPYKVLADTLDKAGDAMKEVAITSAERAGYDSVRKDEDGSLVVDRSPLPIIGEAGIAFSRAARFSYLAKVEPEIANKATQLRLEFQSDPEGFKQAWGEYGKSLTENAEKPLDPMLKASVSKVVDREGGQNYRTALVTADNLNTQNAVVAYKRRLTDLDNDGAALARQGGTDTDAYKEIQTGISQLYNELGSDQRFKYPPDRIASELAEITSKHKGEAIIGRAAAIFDKGSPGSAGEAREFLQSAASDPNLNLKPSQRQSIVTRGMAALEGKTGENKASVDANKKITTEFVEGLKTDAPYDARALNDHIDRSAALGDTDSYYKLVSYKGLYDFRAGLRGQALPVQYAALRSLQSGPGYVDRVARVEGGNDPNAKATTSSAEGLGQFIQQTWLGVLKRNGAPEIADKIVFDEKAKRYTTANPDDLKPILDLRRNPGLSRSMIEKYGEENRAALKNAGISADDNSLYLAHFLGAGDATKVLKASSDTPLVGLISQASIDANPGVFGRNQTAGALQAWAARTGGGGNGSAASLWNEAVRIEAANDMRKFVGGKVEGLVASAETALGKGRRLSDDELGVIVQGIQLTGRTDLLPRMENAAHAFDKSTGLLDQPAGVRQSLRGQMQAKAADGSDPALRAVADTAEETVKRTEEGMRTTPYTTASVRGMVKPPGPFAFDKPDVVAFEAAQRVNNQAVFRQVDELGPASIFEGSEGAAAKAALVSGDPQNSAALLAKLQQTMPADVYKATMSSEPMRQALDGMVRSYDPVKLNAAMSTLDVLYRADDEGFVHTFGEDTWRRLVRWQARRDSLTPQQMAEYFQRADDPAQRSARADLEKEAKEKVKGLKPSDVSNALGSWAERNVPFVNQAPPGDPLSAHRLVNEYKTLVEDLYVDTGDMDKAKEEAGKRIKTIWGPSGLADGALMRRPPEQQKSYPPVDGSHDWMKKQVETELALQLGRPMTESVDTGDGVVERRNWRYQLFATPDTDADISAGRPPRYGVRVVDPVKGGAGEILMHQGGVTPRLFWFDPKSAQEESRANFGKKRQQELWRQDFFGEAATLPGGF